MDKPGLLADGITHARLAIGFLTRLPVDRGLTLEADALARAAWAFPLAGLLVGGLAATGLVVLGAIGVPPLAALVLVSAFGAWFTRGLHEDGLADFADGIGAPERARRLEIMRDSRIGTFGVLALVSVLALRLACLAALPGIEAMAATLLAAALVSRAAMAPVMAILPAARADGLARHAGRPSGTGVLGAVVVALVLAMSAVSWSGVLLGALAVAGVTGWLALLVRSRLGGQTGDVLGAVQQVAEAAFLLVLASLAA